jgi:hypothetical protein
MMTMKTRRMMKSSKLLRVLMLITWSEESLHLHSHFLLQTLGIRARYNLRNCKHLLLGLLSIMMNQNLSIRDHIESLNRSLSRRSQIFKPTSSKQILNLKEYIRRKLYFNNLQILITIMKLKMLKCGKVRILFWRDGRVLMTSSCSWILSESNSLIRNLLLLMSIITLIYRSIRFPQN